MFVFMLSCSYASLLEQLCSGDPLLVHDVSPQEISHALSDVFHSPFNSSGEDSSLVGWLSSLGTRRKVGGFSGRGAGMKMKQASHAPVSVELLTR